MRRHGATDGNQARIVRALRAVGRRVFVTSAVGGGFPDLVVAWGGRMVLMEVKEPGAKLTWMQQRFFDTWPGPVVVVHDEGEALKYAGVLA